MFLRRLCANYVAIKIPWLQTLLGALEQLFGYWLRRCFSESCYGRGLKIGQLNLVQAD